MTKQGYYKWVKRFKPDFNSVDIELNNLIQTINQQFPFYGSRRIVEQIKFQFGWKVSRNKVVRHMKISNVQATKRKRVFKYLFERPDLSSVENLLLKEKVSEFSVSSSNKVWCTDITYLPTKDKMLYLLAIIDIYDKEIISYSVSNKMDKNFVLKAVNEAFVKRNKPKNLVLHSDRGSQYRSIDYFSLCQKLKISISMSRPGNPLDNAVIESWNSTMKHELNVRRKFKKIHSSQIYEIIDKYIHFYNNERIHSSLNYLTPKSFFRKFIYNKDVVN